MAILKHLASHNSHYQDAVNYFLFQHDEHARPIYNAQHKMILRNNYLIDAINTDVWTYSVDCQISNQKWGKNLEKGDVKSHHIIISFPEEDRDEHGLTLEKAQAFGMEFARKHFGGHQCVVATHDDGNNHSGNIHLHIAFNSLRIKDVEPPPYSGLERDYKAGFKYQMSRKCMHYLKADLEQMCRDRGLSQIPLNRPARSKVTDKEYWAEKRGQDKLNQKNENIRSIGGKPTETKFQTELSRIRSAIEDTKQKCNSVEDFKSIMKRDHNIEVTESRGRWSYLPEYRKKPITSRRLGDDYSKENIETFIAQRIQAIQDLQAQAEHEKEKQEQQGEQHQIPQVKPAEEKAAKEPKPEPLPPRPVIESVTFGRIIDLNDPKIQASYGLTQWAKIQNLKNMSLSFNYLTEHHLLNMDDLRATIDDLQSDFSRDTQVLIKTEKKLNTVNMLLKNLGIYHKFRPIHQQYIKSRKSLKFKEKYMRELLLYDGAVKKLQEYQKHTTTNSIPNMKTLQLWKTDFTAQQQELYDRRRRTKDSIQAMEDGYRLLEQLQPRQKLHSRQQYHQLE